MESTDRQQGILGDIRILDLADESGSFCCKLLADLGATVIKIEKPGGPTSRSRGPVSKDIFPHGRNLSFWYNNATKQGITLDIGKDEGKEIFLKLLPKTDGVVETFPPGYLDRLGLGYDALKQLHPGIVLASITGFGQNGPRNGYKSCDLVSSAFGGQMYVSGDPSSAPLKPHGEQSFYLASLFCAIGILMALRRRARTGKGDHIDISAQEAVASTLDHVMVRYFYDQVIPQRRGGVSWNNSAFLLPCKDGHIHLSIATQWETLVEWMNSEGMAEDLTEQKWRDEQYRLGHAAHIIGVLEKWTLTHSVKELFELGQAMRFPWAPVCTPEDVLHSPQLSDRGFFNDPNHPDFGKLLAFPAIPFRFDPIEEAGAFFEEGHSSNLSGRIGTLQGGNPKTLLTSCHSGAPMTGGFLSGLRIIDFTRVLAGPYATRLLADFGAEVIKVQSRKTATGTESNTTGYFAAWNRGKRSVTLDMDHPEARQIILKLAAVSDVVIENFAPRVMSNWGLDYERLRRVNPDLIMVRMSAMGQTGPWKDFVAFGPTLQALSGLTYLTSYQSDAPVGMGYAYADSIAGLYAVFALLAALRHRHTTGQGRCIDLSEYEAICTFLGPAFLETSLDARKILPQGNGPDTVEAAPHGCYKCKGTDRWCVIAAFDEVEWQALCKTMGSPAWAREERFSTLPERTVHREELDRFIGQWTALYAAEEVVALLQEAGVPAGVVQNAEDLAKDPHLAANTFFAKLNHPVLGETFSDRSPIRFREGPAPDWKAAPLLGQDNRYVYMELLGLTEEEFTDYTAKGAFD